ncbi:hypothetical protein [Helicobacter sp. 23-1045]
MTLIIENVKEEYLPAFREFTDKMNVSLRTEVESIDYPTQETIDALENSHTVLKTSDYAEFEKMMENE